MSLNTNVMSELDIAEFLKSLKIGEKFSVVNVDCKSKVLDAARKTSVVLREEQKLFKYEFERV